VSVGTVIGATAGFYGGALDNALMRLTDISLALPDLPILIVLSKYLGGSVSGVVLVVSLFAWRGIARLVRGEVLKLRGLDFTEAARALDDTPEEHQPQRRGDRRDECLAVRVVPVGSGW